MKVIRTENNGATNPGGFAIAVEDADAAEMRPLGDHNHGLIFFTSARKEKEIQRMKRETENGKAVRQNTGESGWR